MKVLQVTAEEEKLFLQMIAHREQQLATEQQTLRTLREKLEEDSDKVIQSAKVKPELKPETSWIEKIVAAFQQIKQPVTSGSLVSYLMKEYPVLTDKGRKFVTKAITSKLWVMQERGDVTKEAVNGKYVYKYSKSNEKE